MNIWFLIISAICGLANSQNFDPSLGEKLNTAYWYQQNVQSLQNRLRQLKLSEFSGRKKYAKNIIFFMGDGLGISTATAARKFLAEKSGETFYEAKLSWDDFPYTGFAKDYSLDSSVPDSASSSTAFLCGVKTLVRYLGVDATADLQCETNQGYVDSIAHWSALAGKDAGVVTTTRLTHASPATTYAKIPNRRYEAYEGDTPTNVPFCKDIALQFLENGRHLRVALGGGWRNFISENLTHPGDENPGRRNDGRNLLKEWVEDRSKGCKKAKYVSTLEDLNSVSDDVDFLLGLFSRSHLDLFGYPRRKPSQPRLADMTEKAIRILSTNDNGYFLFIEGGRIDHAHHYNNARLALVETLEFNIAIERALAKVDLSETLIVITADHSHTMTIGGSVPHETSILGLSAKLADDEKTYTSILYANGPGGESILGGRPNATTEEVVYWEYVQQAVAPLQVSTHSGEDVPVYAVGPFSEFFSGTFELSYIPWAMACAANIDTPAYSSAVKDVCKLSSYLLNDPMRHNVKRRR